MIARLDFAKRAILLFGASILLGSCAFPPRESPYVGLAEECSRFFPQNVSSLTGRIGSALSGAVWSGQNFLVGRPILVATPEGFVLTGYGSIDRGVDFFSRLDSQLPSLRPRECTFNLPASGSSHAGSSVSVLFVPSLRKVSSGTEHVFDFIYPHHDLSRREVGNSPQAAASVLGRYLYVTLPSIDASQLIELERTLVHEGMHLFGQGHILGREPEPPAMALSGRGFLEQKVLEDPLFRKGVIAEVCEAHRVLRLIIESRPSREEVREGLRRMRANAQQRFLFYNSRDVELFWYYTEGIPQYLDHQILLRPSGSTRDQLLSLYDGYCKGDISGGQVFYPNLVGAAYLHGYEYLVGLNHLSWSSRISSNGPLNFLDNLYGELQ